MLKARVRGVYGVLDTVVDRRPFNSLLSEMGESFICISSTSIVPAARWEAVGMRDHTPRRKLAKKVDLHEPRLAPYCLGLGGARGTYAMTTVTANVPLAIKQ